MDNINIKDYDISDNVKMKLFDEFGLPLDDGYNY